MPSFRGNLRSTGFVVLSLLVAPAGRTAWAQGVKSSSNSPPSVLLVTIDTLRADHVGCYGYGKIKTPALDGLARQGVRFENAYAQVPITLPSHTVILTGTYPMFNGVRDFTSRGLPDNIPTLAEILRRQGYQTAAFVSSFALSSMWGLNRGFEVYDDFIGTAAEQNKSLFQAERRGDRTTDRMLDWMAHRDARRPFFVWLHLYDPHSPYDPPEPYRSRYAARPYDGEIAFDDEQVGRVMARLRALNLYENTLIVFVSDHGESLGEHGEGEHGFFIYDATIRVPLILKLPGPLPAGRLIAQPVATVDLAPTIAQVCGISPEQTRSFQGRSLLELMRDSGAVRPDAVYAESFYPRDSFGWHELRAVIGPQFKYIQAPRAELYDLRSDPGERRNILATQSTLANALREKLSELETRYQGKEDLSSPSPLDSETVEKLKSLGYLSFQAAPAPDDTGLKLSDPKDKVSTFEKLLRALVLTREGKYAQADRLLTQLEGGEAELYILYYQKGENDLAWGRPQAAAQAFEKSLSLNPRFSWGAVALGRAYFTIGQDERAARALELALLLNPSDFLARAALAKVHWRLNQLPQAEAELEKVTSAHPEFSEGHADYGIVLAKLRKYPQAVAEIERGIKAGYEDATAFNYLGVAYAETGSPDKAIAAYQRAVALNPRYAAAYLNLALQFRRRRQPTQARQYFEKACQLSTDLCRQYEGQFSKD